MQKLYTVEEAAEALRVKRQAIYKYMNRGYKGVRLGFVMVGGERRVTQAQIDAFIKASTAVAGGIVNDDTIEDMQSPSHAAALQLA